MYDLNHTSKKNWALSSCGVHTQAKWRVSRNEIKKNQLPYCAGLKWEIVHQT
jgi:hypothetical protein